MLTSGGKVGYSLHQAELFRMALSGVACVVFLLLVFLLFIPLGVRGIDLCITHALIVPPESHATSRLAHLLMPFVCREGVLFQCAGNELIRARGECCFLFLSFPP